MYSCSSSMVKDSKSTDENPQRKPLKRGYTKRYKCARSLRIENNICKMVQIGKATENDLIVDNTGKER